MRIAIRSGHNTKSIGAVGLIDETTEAIKVKNALFKYLQQLGHEVLDVTPGPMDSDSDLVYGVSKANSWRADLFVSIHFNKAFGHYQGALGTESWIYSRSDNIKLDEEVASRITMALSNLGFKNRGIKESAALYELKSTKMASIIVEVCFVEATEDVALYKQLGADLIGKTIAEAIANKKIKEEYDMDKAVLYYGDADVFSAILVAQKNQCGLFKKSDFDAKGYKAKQVIQVGGKAEDKNRYVTAINAANLLK